LKNVAADAFVFRVAVVCPCLSVCAHPSTVTAQQRRRRAPGSPLSYPCQFPIGPLVFVPPPPCARLSANVCTVLLLPLSLPAQHFHWSCDLRFMIWKHVIMSFVHKMSHNISKYLPCILTFEVFKKY
jgi:hypothetical protein